MKDRQTVRQTEVLCDLLVLKKKRFNSHGLPRAPHMLRGYYNNEEETTSRTMRRDSWTGART